VSNSAEQRSSTGNKTERRTHDVTEIVTAMAGLAFSMAGEETQMRDAMPVLTLLFGLAGVVVGYYFGRVPAEKRADTATNAMDLAMQERTGIINQADKIHNDMQRGMDKAGLEPGMLQDPSLTKDRVTTEQFEQIKNILTLVQTEISNMTETLPPSARSN
jgi:hypothetical protein